MCVHVKKVEPEKNKTKISDIILDKNTVRIESNQSSNHNLRVLLNTRKKIVSY